MGVQNHCESLIGTLQQFRETGFLCDTVLVTDDRRELKAHSAVLAAASPVFLASFQATASSGLMLPGPVQVNLREFRSDLVEMVLDYIYTGNLPLSVIQCRDTNPEWLRLVEILNRLGLDRGRFEEQRTNVERCTESPEILDLKTKEEDTVSSDSPVDCSSFPTADMDEVRPVKPRRRKIKRPIKKTTITSETSGRKTEIKAEGKRAEKGPKKAFFCSVCGRRFSRLEGVRLHERTHSGDRPYECTTCGRRFALSGNLRRHLQLHASRAEQPFMCDQCGHTFIRREYLLDHVARHRADRPFPCPEPGCSKRYSSSSQLRLHTRAVHGDEAARQKNKYRCEICGKFLSTSSNLKTHRRRHNNDKPFKCPVCDRTFAQKTQLQSHSRTHTDERPYKCDQCPRTFRFSASLTTHRRTHDDSSPPPSSSSSNGIHRCDKCEAVFADQRSFLQHDCIVASSGNCPTGLGLTQNDTGDDDEAVRPIFNVRSSANPDIQPKTLSPSHQ